MSLEGHVLFDRVWKKFRRGELHDSLRDLIPALARRLVGKGPNRAELEKGDFWAVKDVSFEVTPGEALGIIGPNGAGKSTILKLLSGILRPNRGSCEVRGRIGALIEVAAGFHPDLTGGENIYLQGSIMGMKKDEIERKFDEIVEFAGLPEFIDTQVKRYSTGMNARLGFAIAAHLDPEVLLIDEVLAVGDYAFQKRAFERIAAMVRRDIPVVIVSHQLDRIAQLCTKAILLEQGEVRYRGTPTDTIAAYVGARVRKMEEGPDGDATPVRLESLAVDMEEELSSGEPVRLEISCFSEAARTADLSMQDLAVGFRVVAAQTGQLLFASGTERFDLRLPRQGSFVVEAELSMNVPGGVYLLETLLWDRKRGQQLASGPATYLRVKEGHSFSGSVNLQPRVKVRAGQAADVRA